MGLCRASTTPPDRVSDGSAFIFIVDEPYFARPAFPSMISTRIHQCVEHWTLRISFKIFQTDGVDDGQPFTYRKCA